jgi:hypothetical protein
MPHQTRPSTSQIVFQLFHNIIEAWPDVSGYHIFSDQFYINPTLASELSKVRCHLTVTVMNNRKAVPAVMKKPKLRKSEKVPYRNNENILLLALHDKHLVTLFSTWSTYISEPVRSVRGKKRSFGEASCNCKLHGEHGQNGYCRSVHDNILLLSEDTEMGTKIIIP